MNEPAVATEAGICVVHLVWAPLGLSPFRAFLDSYRRHPGGVAHRLLIVLNGFSSRAEAAPYLELLAGLAHSTLWLPEPVQDIAAYGRAAEVCAERWLCFLNSYSVILGADWLRKMSAPLNEKTRLVGASGSWESMATNLERQNRLHPLRWRWLPHGIFRRWQRWLAERAARRHYLAFPNPHLRTNAFLIERTLLLSLGPISVRTKDEAHRFESGRHGLSARVRGLGVEPCVVDREGRVWLPGDWPMSKTFRDGSQENLLVADNRTRDYEEATPATRRKLSFNAWGLEEPV